GFLLKKRCAAAPVYATADPGEIEMLRTRYLETVEAAEGNRTDATQAALNDWRTAQGRNPAADRARDAALEAASIILKALMVVECLQQLAGFGPPYQGDDLKSGSTQLASVGQRLAWASGDGQWRGLASQGYSGLNTGLQNIVQGMAELDHQLAEIIKIQASLVTHVRLGFGILTVLLSAAYNYEIRMAMLPGAQIEAQIYAKWGAMVGICTAVSMLSGLCALSEYNASEADKLTRQYRELASGSISSAVRPVDVNSVAVPLRY
ncbi:MAG: hypothetical protein K2Q25_06395, partial [Mycobacteriaceae bacterium]|nr:hypothetical protein [Mycobacteriaceae bacterium]